MSSTFVDPSTEHPAAVLRVSELDIEALKELINPWGLELVVAEFEQIPGSYWGEDEAGLVGNRLYATDSTPVHSALHEACHYICMEATRRDTLNTNAGGDYDEENGVCYLQILLSDLLPGMGRTRMLADMDAWGYTFRLGSARAWFENDAEDARQWLLDQGLIGAQNEPLYRLRD